MTFTDYLRLSEHKIFKALCNTLPKDIKKTQNVLIIKDDVLFTWDFQSNCVLTLNVKSVRGREGDNVIYQTLLPTSPPLFTPELLVANDEGTLLAIAGPNGVLVLELPRRCPPYGAFSNNKELVYCRSHSLDERLLATNVHVEVRQVRFHPGSLHDTHLVVLTSDNIIRLYNVENSEAVALGAYSIGRQPVGFMPGSNTPYLEVLGETAVDFDFGPPELNPEKRNVFRHTETQTELDIVERDLSKLAVVKRGSVTVIKNTEVDVTVYDNPLIPKVLSPPPPSKQRRERQSSHNSLLWPIYILRGDGSVYTITIQLYNKTKPQLQGPLPMSPSSLDSYSDNSCAILCIKSTPSVLCLARNNGTIYHCVVLPKEESDDTFELSKSEMSFVKAPNRSLCIFETVELELGLTTTEMEANYRCPIFLHKDESSPGRYFASHDAGVHSVTVPAIDDLQKFLSVKDDDDPLVDLFTQSSTAEYLVCTKSGSSGKVNPVVGFTLYHEPTSIVSLLSDGQLVTLALITTAPLPSVEDFGENAIEELNSPLKKMLREPFDMYIQKILKQVNPQPILKLPPGSEKSQQESYELLQRASKVFREEYFKHHEKAREEIEKRVKALQMLKKYQTNQIEKLKEEKQILQEKAENLAEKYEDIKDKQDELTKRCEKLLIMVSQKKTEPSEAEKGFVDDLKDAQKKVQTYTKAIEKVRIKKKYQEIHMENWKEQHKKKITTVNPIQSDTIKANLQDMTNKITEMAKQVREHKKTLNLK